MKVRLFIFIFFVHASLFSQHLELVQPVRFLALGDSYTAGIAVDPSQSWPNQLFDRLNGSGFNTEKLQILAQAGWTTEDLAAAIREGNLQTDFNLVALLIGVNNQYQGVEVDLYEKDFEALPICGKCDYLDHPAWAGPLLRHRPWVEERFPGLVNVAGSIYKRWLAG